MPPHLYRCVGLGPTSEVILPFTEGLKLISGFLFTSPIVYDAFYLLTWLEGITAFFTLIDAVPYMTRIFSSLVLVYIILF